MKKDLKPCPFCGCEYINVNYIKEGQIFIECPKCGVETKIMPEHEAIEMWNRRSGNSDAKEEAEK